MSKQTLGITVKPLHHAFGVEVEGVSLSDLDDSSFAQIRELYDRHSLLLFRGQTLEAGEQVALGKRFGVPSIPPRPQFNLTEFPEISLLGNALNADGSPRSFFNEMGEEWHSDSAGYENLDGVTFLYALKVPPQGGETMFCSMIHAWDTLSSAMQQQMIGRRVLHSWNHHNDKVMKLSKGKPLTASERARRPDHWNDLVQDHPVSKRRLYYLSHNLVKQVDDWPEQESLDFVMPLVEHATEADKVLSHQWRPGDMVLWDNRALMHSATNVDNYRDSERLLWRSYSFTGTNALAGGKLAS